MPTRSNATGGSAAARGFGFQAEVAALFAAHAVSEHSLPSSWVGPGALVHSIALETSAPVDDILVVTGDGRQLFVQAKTSPSLSKAKDGDLVAFADQAVRLFAGRSESSKDPATAFTPGRDVIVLAVSHAAPATIREHLCKALDLSRTAMDIAAARAALHNDDQRSAHAVLCDAIAIGAEKTPSSTLTGDELVSLLRSVRVVEFAFEGADRRAAVAILAGVLDRPSDGEAAFRALGQHAHKLMQDRGAADARTWRGVLEIAGLSLKAPPSYQTDVEKIRAYSARTLDGLRAQQSFVSDGRVVRIERECVPAVRSASLAGHLLLLGEPGAGKSAVLVEVADALAADAETVVIAVEQLSGSDLHGLRGDLGVEHQILDILDHWPGTGPVVVCIDALDASRGGPTETAVKALIAGIIGRGSSRLRVLASVRTFDLTMGARYRELFSGAVPAPELGEADLKTVRHVVVRVWSEAELAQLLEQAPLIAEALAKSPDALRRLVMVPFNSRLLAALLDDGRAPESFAKIHVQADLLAAFWDRRVAPFAPVSQNALIETIDLMIARQKMQAPYATLSAHAGLPETLQAGILLVTDNRYVTFRHHILFDYAVSRLRLDPSDHSALRNALAKSKGVGFLLAPAVGYSLGALWHGDAGDTRQFWDVFLDLAADPAVDPIARVMITRLAAELPGAETDVDALVQAVASGRATRAAVGALCSAILAGPEASSRLGPWATLIDVLADDPRKYGAPCRSLLYWALQAPAAANDRRIASASRRLLQYAVSGDGTDLTVSAIDATAKTFGVDPKAARAALELIFEPAHLAQHAHAEVPWLCRHIEIIARYDAVFATEVYTRVFAHAVDDGSSIPMSRSQILPLSSTRRQDYGMAYWELAERFPQFLAAHPKAGALALIKALEGYCRREYPPAASEQVVSVAVDGDTVRLLPDHSHIWASNPDGETYDDAERMLGAFVRWLRTAPIAEANDVAGVIRSSNHLAVVWARAFMVAVERDDGMVEVLAPIAALAEFIHCNDTKKDAIDLVAVALGRRPQAVRDEFVMRVEAFDYSGYAEPAAAKTRLLQRIAAMLGKGQSPRPPASESVAADERSNPRLVTTSIDYGAPEDWWWMSRNGVDVRRTDHQIVLASGKSLETTTADYTSEKAPGQRAALIAAIEDVAGRRDKAAIAGADQHVLDYVDDTLCKAVLALLDDSKTSPGRGELALARRVALQAAGSPNPRGGEAAEKSFESSPAWSSPAPRAEAAAVVMSIARFADELDAELRGCIERALADGDPVVRHHATIRLNSLWNSDREWLWRCFLSVARTEPNKAVLKFFLNYPVARVTGAEPGRVAEITAILWSRFGEESTKPAVELRDEIAQLTAYLAVYHDVAPAMKQLQAWRSEAGAFQSELTHVLHALRDGLTLGLRDGKPAGAAIRVRTVAFIGQVVETCGAILDRHYAQHRSASEADVAQATAAAKLIDVACMQLLFAYAPSNGSERPAPDVGRVLFRENLKALTRIAEVGTPRTVHHLLDLLEKLVDVEPDAIFDLTATALLVAGPLHGYANDTLALTQFVRLMGRFLADHRGVFFDSGRRDRLIAMIDCFIEAGWPEARRLLNSLPDLLR